jgi:Loader and inhibitor of phage G40P
MTFEDTVKLLSMIQRLYPNQIKMIDKKDFDVTAKLWERCLWNIDYKSCAEALIIHARTSQYAPQPNNIIDICEKRYRPEVVKSGLIAWEEVCQAVKKYGFNRQSEAFNTFDEKLKRTVRAIGWWNICYSEKPEFVKKEFVAFWDNLKAVEQEQIRFDDTKWLVEQIREHGGSLEEPERPIKE